MTRSLSPPQIKPVDLPDPGAARMDAPLVSMRSVGNGDATSAFEEFKQSAESADEATFLEQLETNDALSDFLTAVFVLSPYLRDLALKFPETIAACHADGFQATLTIALRSMKLDSDHLLDETVVMSTLRVAKRKAALICGLADLGGWWNSSDVSKGISETADGAVQTTVSHLLTKAHHAGKISLPNVENPSEDSGYSVIAMGKHGAHELNYSSDIDLIVFFDPDAPAVLDRDDSVVLFGRLTRSLVKIMQDPTADGYVFRTDLRLRPDPGSMPIAVPIGLAMHYYESRGQNWERAAFIKARVIAGDIKSGEQILKELEPFVWRRYLDYAAIADVHSIKRQIQAHKGYEALHVPGHNVKLGRGGIREIEFFVQTQQLIAGGRAPELRGRRTLEMLDELARSSWVEPKVSSDLKESYSYLRDVEHRLQMISDAQTHIVPEDDAGLQAIASLCGFKDTKQFVAATMNHLARVEGHYADLFEDEPELAGDLGNLSFTGDDDDPGTLETLSKLGFERPSEIIAMVRGWHFGRYKAMQSTDARERLTEITPSLLESFASSGNAREALIAFDHFLKGLPAGFQLFNLLKANPHLLNLLVMVLGVAPRLAAIITRKPHVFDGLLEPDFFHTEVTADILDERLARSLASARDYEDGLDRARQFAAEQKFLIGIRVLGGSLAANRAGQAFATLAECMLRSMLAFVRQEFELRHGVVPNASMAVVGMGNLGTSELTAGSDLDLLVLYEYDEDTDTSGGERSLHASQYFARLTQRLIAAMSAPTAEGIIYELDFRLRPSGNSGPLATTLSSFCRYQKEDAWDWERLALTRARVVTGDGSFVGVAQNAINELVQSRLTSKSSSTEIEKMRTLMDKERPAKSVWDVKLAKGGLIDLEFMAQWAVLSGSVENTWSSRGALEKLSMPELLEAFDTYTTVLQISRICLADTYTVEEAPSGLTNRLLKELDFPDIKFAEAQLADVQKRTRVSFKSYFKN